MIYPKIIKHFNLYQVDSNIIALKSNNNANMQKKAFLEEQRATYKRWRPYDVCMYQKDLLCLRLIGGTRDGARAGAVTP